ncbi:type I polyketide synthase [Nocardia jiangsuensis]|uniref:Type I polyketide synthase n=1 Tax=Nocardia jiangsuensis TaxID=1691563 RepID=A0ABV8DZZ9_9NOCA
MDLAGSGIAVARSAVALGDGDTPVHGGVSSFGFGGVNCHVVLSGAPGTRARKPVVRPEPEGPVPWVFSARGQAALHAQAAALSEWAGENPGTDIRDTGWSLASTRTRFENRAVVVGGDHATLWSGVAALAAGEPHPAVVTGVVAPGERGAVFVFPGQGGQWLGMGRELLATSTVFARRLAECEAALAPWVPWSLSEVLASGDEATVRPVDVLQPLLWAVMVSVAAVWEAHGVRPAAVIGHSQGEIAAAVVAGALSLPDAARVVASRSTALRVLRGTGTMLSIALPLDRIREHCADPLTGGRVAIAAVNGPASVVLSGPEPELQQVVDGLGAEVRTRWLPVDYPSHSAGVEILRDELTRTLTGLTPVASRVPVYSTVTARVLDTTRMDTGYWYENLRGTVAFHDAVTAAAADGFTRFVEVSPHPVLAGALEETLGGTGVVVGSLRRDQPERAQLLLAAAQLFVTGTVIDWAAVYGPDVRRVRLPTYAFQRRSFWAETVGAEPGPIPAPAAAADPRPVAPIAGAGDALELVRKHTAVVLGHTDPSGVAVDLTFRDLGFDSIMATRLQRALAEATGAAVPATLVFDHPTPLAVAEFLRGGADLGTEHTAPPMPAAEPLAVVGMACRLPGGISDPDRFWQFLLDEGDAVTTFPADRGWDLANLFDSDPDAAGKSYAREGGFLDGAGDFDAGFFGISPREALAMDPQQRLMLETSWEALERAGVDPVSLRGSDTGVFVGVMPEDYGPRLGSQDAADGVEGYLLTGSAGSVVSGRVAYALGLHGPAVTVDTACSSSLVALHLAGQALRSGECSLAVAGGVTVLGTPGIFVDFARQRGLAPDGRCKSFAGAADGTGWAEGVGVLVLERLSAARANGHRVLAVLRGSAVNQDGASNGLTAPNGPAQQRVIRRALAAAGLTTADVDLVEAHGTGTALGDPIEAQALLATYGQDRHGGEPVRLGSVKSNIGHTQAAAGVTGVIKAVLALRHGVMPATLHVDEPTPEVDWAAGAVELVTAARDWPETGRPRRAAVSSFGISGTNAHVIVEQAPDIPEPPGADPGPVETPLAWVVSGRGRRAATAQAERIAGWLRAQPETVTTRAWLADAGRALLESRSLFENRTVVLGADRAELLAALDAAATEVPHPGVVSGAVAADSGVVFVFPGQGGQWLGMGRELLATSPVFAERMAECESALAPYVSWSLRAAIGDEELLARVDVVQPVLWAVMVSLAAVWEAGGVRPAAVIGHSQGEIAAMAVAGVLSLEDGARVVALRSAALRTLAGTGTMLSAGVPVAEVRERFAGELADGRVALAAVNGPASVVLSGSGAALERVVAGLGAEVRTRWLPVDYPSHSPAVEVLRTELVRAMAGIVPARGRVPVYSTVTASVLDPDAVSGEYWYENLRATVAFHGAVGAAIDAGFTRFVEVSPHPVLTTAIGETLAGTGVVVGSLRRDQPEQRQLRTAAAQLFVTGTPVDLTTGEQRGGHRVELPTYAFQHRRYWLETTPATVRAADDARFWELIDRGDVRELNETIAPADAGTAAWAAVLPGLAAWRQTHRRRSRIDSWRHRVVWKPAPDGFPAAALTGRWLVAGEHASWTEQCVAALERHGATVERLRPPGAERDDWRAAVDALGGDIAGVVSLLGLDEHPHPGYPAVPAGSAATLALLHGLGDAGIAAPLWCLTGGAVGTGPSDPVRHPAQAAVWGLGRVAALENPGGWGGSIDLPAEPDAASWDRVCAAMASGTGEDQIAVRRAGILVRRLVQAPPLADPVADDGWTAATVVITGGTGALGAHLARWAVRRGARHLVLLSRRGQGAPGAAELGAELRDAGCEVRILACDTADRAALTAVLADIPISAVLHAAGTDCDLPLADTDLEALAHTLGAKAFGASVLDELLTGRPELRLFVLFSSGAGIWGGAGQGAYAAANAYLDALAEQRGAAGLPATAIAWGPWAERGMAAGALGGRLARSGLTAMPPELAVEALQQVVDHRERTVTVVDADWPRFHSTFALARPRPLLHDLPGVRPEPANERPDGSGSVLAERLAGLPRAEQDRRVLALVRAGAAAVVGEPDAGSIGADRAFRDLGFDSLTLVELRAKLIEITGLELATTIALDHPTPAAVAAHLLRLVRTEDPAEPEPVRRAGPDDEPLAVIGMACRLPGGISTPEQLWQLVLDGGDAVTAFPADRGWDLANLFDPDPDATGKSYAREGGFLHDAADFDAEFFGISPREALAMDPQQRLLLETGWEALENAGIAPESVRGSDVGVFVGAMPEDYGPRLGTAGVSEQVEGYLLTGTSGSVVSGRLSYVLGLEGPAVTVDTACSSSLVALHLAGQALRSGECSMALAGGVTVMATPGPFIDLSRQRGLAADGRCKAFDAAADGFGPAEGAGVVVLERLSEARANGHPVLAVLRGSAVNQDGASNGLTAPNGPAQQRVIRRALAAAGLTTADVDVVEAHGTGTALGDPIEAQALLATYGRDRETPLWLGSVKSNIGHTQAAAGVTGVIKMVSALRYGVLPATLHVHQPSPHVDWESGAVRLLTTARDWPEHGRPRRAAVSSFGISGTNAHLVLEAAPPLPAEPAATPDRTDRPVVWVLSGRGEHAAAGQAGRLAAWLREHPGQDPADVGWSSVTTRSMLPDRIVLLGRDAGQLPAALDAAAAGTPHPAVVAGSVTGADRRVAYLFGGQGSQRIGMGRELADAFPAFAAAVDEVCAHLDGWLPRPLREVLFAAPDSPDALLLNETHYTQAGLFAVEVALFRLLESFALTPDLLLGHSIGGLAAAHVAGVMSLPDAARVVAERGRLMQRLPAGGAMVSIRADEAEVAASLPAVLGADAGRVALAAVNAPDAVVISGDLDAVTAVAEHWSAAGYRTKPLTVSHAFHSHRMDPMLDEFRTVLERIELRAPLLEVVSDSTGALLTAEQATSPEYWVRHVRDTVRFAGALAYLAEQDVTHYVELGEGALASLAGGAGVALLRGENEAEAMLTGVARLFTAGVDVDWRAVYAGRDVTRVALPTYAFRRRRYWLDSGPPPPPVTGSWRYRVRWRPTTAPLGEGRLTGTWLIAAAPGHERLVAACAEALAGHGANTVVLAPELDRIADREAWERQLTAPVSGVLSLLGLLDTELGTAATAALVQGLGAAGIRAPLWSATRGAVAVGPSDAVTAPLQAMVWGLGRVVALEHPENWGGLVDLPGTLDARAARALCEVLSGTGAEDQVAIRSAGTFLRRLVPAPAAADGALALTGGTVLITGGTGALGAHVARWAVGEGAARLLLLSRGGPAAPGAGALIAELRALAPEVGAEAIACDITDLDAVAAVLAAIPAEHPLTAVVHTAGVGTMGTVAELDATALAAVTAAKVGGATVLHRLLGAEGPAARLVLFSSAAGVWGGGGQAAYSAANAYLDALAEHRSGLGLPTTAVAWGPWAEGGMAAGEVGETMDRRGLRSMPPESAVPALAEAFGDTAITIADMDWSRFYPAYAIARPRPFLHEIPAVAAIAAAGSEPAPPEVRTPFLDRLGTATGSDRRAVLIDLVRTEAGTVLGHTGTGGIRPERAFRDLGFDSLAAVELRNRINSITGLELEPTVVFDHPTPQVFADYIGEQLRSGKEHVMTIVTTLERELASLSQDRELFDGALARLEQLLLPHRSRAPKPDADPADLMAATDDEVFDILADEFDIS